MVGALCPSAIAQEELVESIVEEPVVIAPERTPNEQAVWVLRSIRLPDPPLANPIEELAAVVPATADNLLKMLRDRSISELGEESAQIMSIYQRQLLLDAVEASEPAPVLAAVSRMLRSSDDLLSLATVIEIYGVTGDVTRFGTIREHVAELPGEELTGRLEEAIEGAIVGLLGRDARSHAELLATWRDWPRELVPAIVRAVGRTRDPRGLELLNQVIAWDRDLQLLGIAQIVLLGPSGVELIDEPIAKTVRDLLESDDSRLRKAAILALGDLRDLDSVPMMIAMLKSEASGEKENAAWALRKATGVTLNDHANTWTVWFKRESAWHVNSEDVFRKLSSSNDSAVFEAIREISLHSLHRDRLAEKLLPSLEHPNEAIRVAACKGLARLEMPFVVPTLIELLDDREEAVRMAAHKTLVSLTKKDFGQDPKDWAGLSG